MLASGGHHRWKIGKNRTQKKYLQDQVISRQSEVVREAKSEFDKNEMIMRWHSYVSAQN